MGYETFHFFLEQTIIIVDRVIPSIYVYRYNILSKETNNF
jgi:hypothetical protein